MAYHIIHKLSYVRDDAGFKTWKAYDGRLQKWPFPDFFLYIPCLQSRRNQPELSQWFQVKGCNFQNLSAHFGAIPNYPKRLNSGNMNKIFPEWSQTRGICNLVCQDPSKAKNNNSTRGLGWSTSPSLKPRQGLLIFSGDFWRFNGWLANKNHQLQNLKHTTWKGSMSSQSLVLVLSWFLITPPFGSCLHLLSPRSFYPSPSRPWEGTGRRWSSPSPGGWFGYGRWRWRQWRQW